MNRSTLIALAAVALVAIVLAVVVDRAEAPSSQVTGDEPLVPGLKASVNDVDTITITASGENGRFSVVRTGTGWVVPDRSDFPADIGRVRTLLLGLAEARVLETKTSNPELYARLGVEDVTAESGSGLRVTVSGPVSADVIIGNPAARTGKGIYVRRAGEAQSLLVSGDMSPPGALDEWLSRDIVDIPPDAISAVTVAHPDGDVLALASGDAGALSVQDVPEGRELTSPSAADPVGRALTGLRLDDVTPAEESPAPEELTVARYTLADGRVLTARLWAGEDDKRFLRLAVALADDAGAGNLAEAAQAPTGEPGEEASMGPSVEPIEEPMEEPTRAPARADAAEVESENARHAAWTYTIPAYKFDMMTKRMDDLLRPLPATE